jgi:hypothetical protein
MSLASDSSNARGIPTRASSSTVSKLLTEHHCSATVVAMQIHDTDSLRIDSGVIATLIENSTHPDTLAALLDMSELPNHTDIHCIHHAPDSGHLRSISVPLKGSYHEKPTAKISVSRVAFAAARANQLEGLRRHEEAQHHCSDITVDGKRLVCINPAHLFKA